MLRLALLLTLVTQPLLVHASNISIECDWQKAQSHASGYYIPAVISLRLENQKVKILKDSFLFRKYEPCWLGSYSSCAFGFDYDHESDWSIVSKNPQELVIEAPGYYWNAQLKLETTKKFNLLKKGANFSLKLSGDDGDGVMFHNEKFLCKIL